MEMESTTSKMKRQHGESCEDKWPKRSKNLLTTWWSIRHKYNFEAALADLIDNSLQASWSDDTGLRQISIDINEDSICVFHNGTSIDSSQETSIVEWGRNASVHKFDEQSVRDNIDPYLRPFFGKFGYGVAVSSMHIGRRAIICSKTKASDEVHTFDIESDDCLQDSSTGAHILKTDGGMPRTSEEELGKAFSGSFTKVQIFYLHMGSLGLHKLLCRLKDIYFPYIQIDESSDPGRTFSRLVEFQANGKNLAEINGEVSITNSHACSGPEFKLQLRFSLTPEASGSSSTSRVGNARLRCVYFPIIQGEENTDRIIKKLDVSGCGIEGFTYVSVRRLGRLLTNARWARLPFMEPKHRTGDEFYRLRRCYYRVKCFIETDAGFIPTTCKTDLLNEDSYTKALKSFGAELPQNDQGLNVQILKEGEELSLSEMERQYRNWILNMHAEFDEEVVCSDQEAVVRIDPSSKELLGITADVARVCKKVWRKEKFWQSGQKLKISKGASAKFQKTNSYATIEYILVEGYPGATGGEAQFICRKRDTPDDMECIMVKDSDESYTINIRHSIILPLRAIDSGKVTDADPSQWNKKIEKQRRRGSHISVDSVEVGVGECARLEIERVFPNENVTIDGEVPGHEAVTPNYAICDPSAEVSNDSLCLLQGFTNEDVTTNREVRGHEAVTPNYPILSQSAEVSNDSQSLLQGFPNESVIADGEEVPGHEAVTSNYAILDQSAEVSNDSLSPLQGFPNENVIIDGEVPGHEGVTSNYAITGQSADVSNDSLMKGQKLNCTHVPRNGDDANDRRPAPHYAEKNYRRIMKNEHKKNLVKDLGGTRTSPEILVDTHRKAKNDKGVMIPHEAKPIMERYMQIRIDRGRDPAKTAVQYWMKVVGGIKKKRSSPITVNQVIPPSEARALQRKEEALSDQSSTLTGMSDDLFIKVVERTIRYARKHPNTSGPAPNEVRILVQEILDEKSQRSNNNKKPIRFETVMEMVRAMCDLFNAIYTGGGTANDKGKEVFSTRQHKKPSNALLSPRGGPTIRNT